MRRIWQILLLNPPEGGDLDTSIATSAEISAPCNANRAETHRTSMLAGVQRSRTGVRRREQMR
jgi:hypothetical protein